MQETMWNETTQQLYTADKTLINQSIQTEMLQANLC